MAKADSFVRIPVKDGKVADVVKTIAQALSSKGFSFPEVIIGTSEFLGRTIVETCDTYPQMQDLVDATHDHMGNTVIVGVQARQKNGVISLPSKG